jgi:hypothetical protein
LVEDFKRAWLASSLLTVGDALGAAHYFNRAPEAEPEAELVRRLSGGSEKVLQSEIPYAHDRGGGSF